MKRSLGRTGIQKALEVKKAKYMAKKMEEAIMKASVYKIVKNNGSK